MNLDTALQFGLILASAVLAIFCLVLARRLRKLNDLESGLGSAIAIMSAEVDRLEKSILATKNETRAECQRLQDHIDQARRERAAWDSASQNFRGDTRTTAGTADAQVAQEGRGEPCVDTCCRVFA